MALLFLSPNIAAQADFAEPRVKAALLYNFAKFVEWPPAAAKGPLVIGVLGQDEGLSRALGELVEGKPVGERVVVTKHFRSLEDLQLCHVLFIQLDRDDRIALAVKTTAASPVLTVADGRRFPREGGMIGLFFEERKPRFDINAGAVRRSGMKIKAQLLQLAEAVSP